MQGDPLIRYSSARYISFIALILSCFFLFIGWLTYSQLYSLRYNTSQEVRMRLSSHTTSAMELWIEEKVQQVKMLANYQFLKEYTESPTAPDLRLRVETLLQSMHVGQPYLTHIDIVTFLPDGKQTLQFTTGDDKVLYLGHGQVLVDSVAGEDVGKQLTTQTFMGAFEQGTTEFISEVYFCRLRGNQPVFMIAAPIVGNSGQYIGAVCYEIRLDYLMRLFITNFPTGYSSQIELIDSRGFFVGSTDTSKILNPYYKPEVRSVIEKIGNEHEVSFDMPLGGTTSNIAVTELAPSATMPTKIWVLFHRPTTDIHAELFYPLLSLGLISLISIFLIILMAYRLRKATLGQIIAKDAERKQAYVNKAPYGILLVSDKSGVIMDANPASSNIFGYTKSELQGMIITTVMPGFGKDISEWKYGDAELLAKNNHGEQRITICSLQPFTSDASLLFIRDETALVRQRQTTEAVSRNLEKALKEAEAASKAKTEFIANMSHEIRTPMNAIIGFTHLVQMTTLSAQQKDYIGKAHASARFLLTILNNILDFSQIEANKISLEPAPFCPRQIMKETYDLFAQTCQAKGIGYTLDIAEDCPPIIIGDAFRLTQVLSNILDNAVKFTHTGSVVFSCAATTHSSSAVTLHLHIKDTGIGITPQQQQSLFEAFAQGDSSATRQYGGIGLGLSICHRIIRLMGGEIQFESTKGQGMTVTIECPFALPDEAEERQTGTLPMAGMPGTPPALPNFSKRTVLLVEDNLINQQIALELLEATGVTVIVANNGQEALDIATTTPSIDAILMDLQMPVMDGHTATIRLRSMPEFAKTPIIAMTAHAFHEERKHCKDVGMDAHLAKPIDVDLLYTTLAKWLPSPTDESL